MKLFFALLFCVFCAAATAQPYAQAGSSVYSSSLGAFTSSGVDLGYTHGGFDTTIGVFTSRQNTPSHDVHWSGLAASASYSHHVYGPATAFVGYQVGQTPSASKTQWDGRYGAGFTLHIKPAKVSITWVPEQQELDGSKAPCSIGLSVKVRGDL